MAFVKRLFIKESTAASGKTIAKLLMNPNSIMALI